MMAVTITLEEFDRILSLAREKVFNAIVNFNLSVIYGNDSDFDIVNNGFLAITILERWRQGKFTGLGYGNLISNSEMQQINSIIKQLRNV